MTTEAKAYLGDSVYAEWDQGMVKLTTDNGLGPSNTIYLEPEVLRALWYFTAQQPIPNLGPAVTP
jgi:hypothetical protein